MSEYDPAFDLYELLAVRPDASEEEIAAAMDRLPTTPEALYLGDVATHTLLDLDRRTRYDTQRAAHRLRRMMRFHVPVYVGRTAPPPDRDS